MSQVNGDGSGDDILDRLEAIPNELKLFRAVERNEPNLGTIETPACILFDGDEETERPVERGKDAAAGMMTMSPQFSIVIEASAREASRDMRIMRRQLVKAVLTDTTLAALVGRNGARSYRGYETQFMAGEKVIARMWVRFEIAYLFAPTAL